MWYSLRWSISILNPLWVPIFLVLYFANICKFISWDVFRDFAVAFWIDILLYRCNGKWENLWKLWLFLLLVQQMLHFLSSLKMSNLCRCEENRTNDIVSYLDTVALVLMFPVDGRRCRTPHHQIRSPRRESWTRKLWTPQGSWNWRSAPIYLMTWKKCYYFSTLSYLLMSLMQIIIQLHNFSLWKGVSGAKKGWLRPWQTLCYEGSQKGDHTSKTEDHRIYSYWTPGLWDCFSYWTKQLFFIYTLLLVKIIWCFIVGVLLFP